MNTDNSSDTAPPKPFSPTLQLALTKGNRARVEAKSIIKSHMIGAMSVGFVPVPIVDGIALTDIQWNLICRLADHYGVPIHGAYRTMLISAITGSLPVLLAGLGCSVLKLIPGFGQVAGAAALSNLGAAFTYATGAVFMDHFERGGTMRDFRANAFTRPFRLDFRRVQRAAGQLPSGLRAGVQD